MLSNGYTSGGKDGPARFRFSEEFAVVEGKVTLFEVFVEDVSGGEGLPPPRTVSPEIFETDHWG